SSAAASSSGSRQTTLNQRLAFFLVTFVALAPVPLGGARPLFWAISGSIIALAALAYSVALWSKGESFRVRIGSVAPLTFLWAVLIVFLLVQAAPIAGAIGPVTFTGYKGQTFSTSSLSLSPGETLLMALRMAGYGCFFFLALQVAANRDRAVQIGKWLAYIVAAHALYGLVALTQFGDPLLFVEKWAYRGSATGTFVNRNSYATFLAVGLVVSVGLGLRILMNRRMEHL